MVTLRHLSALPDEAMRVIEANTFRMRAPLGVENARRNLPYIRRSVLELPASLPSLSARVVVVGAGPSLRRQGIVGRLKTLRDRFTLVASDASLAACLREGVVPDVVLSLDPHPDRVVRWFGDPKLHERADDDYFRRQDLDVELREDEHARNLETIELVNRHAPQIHAALSTSVAADVTARCDEAGMPCYWWNPLYDDWTQPGSYTRQVFELTKGVPCMTGLGNCGAAAWVLAHAVLGCRRVAVVGMDLGYPGGTSVVNTQYYELVRHLPREQAEKLLLRIENPHTESVYMTDPVYYWYRESFLDAVRRAECETMNCSGEGIVFGPGIAWDTLENFARE